MPEFLVKLERSNDPSHKVNDGPSGTYKIESRIITESMDMAINVARRLCRLPGTYLITATSVENREVRAVEHSVTK